jgi:hypothetical protein
VKPQNAMKISTSSRWTLASIAGVFFLSCIIPPGQQSQYKLTLDGSGMFRASAGYALLFNPPNGYEVQIDFGRLFLEWVALAVVSGMGWLFIVKSAFHRSNKVNNPQKSKTPTGDTAL